MKRGENMDVAYMKEYLRFALETEKNVYALEKAYSQATKDCNQSSAALKQYFNQHNRSVDSINNFDIASLKENEFSAKSKLKKAAIILSVCVIICVIITLVTLILYMSEQEVFIKAGIILVIIAEVVLNSAVIFSFANLVFRFYKWKKTRDIINSETAMNIRNITIRNTSRPRIDEERKRFDILLNKKNHMESVLKEARKSREQLYSNNVLHKDYRNIITVGLMYGYLCRGRCNTIEGPGGIYDTLEKDLQHYETIEKLNVLIDQNAEIIRNQIELHSAIVSGNEMARKMHKEFKDFSETQRKNAVIDQIQRQQANESLSYIQWSMTH